MIVRASKQCRTVVGAVTAPHLVALALVLVRLGARFERGILLEREQTQAALRLSITAPRLNEGPVMSEPATAPTAFVRAYEEATNSHDIAKVAPLIATEAVYWFSDGSHHGRDAVLTAIAETFATIHDETYQIVDLEWIAISDTHAVCRYRFTWTGTVNGQPASGSGRGTNVLVNSNGTWQMLHEHLSA